MKRFQLTLIFSLCLALTLLAPIFLPFYRLNFFAPFIVIAYYHKSFENSLWLSFICGVILDLLNPLPRLGIYALNFCLTTCLLYSKKQHFFEDSLTTLPFMSFLFSLLSTMIQALIILLIIGGVVFSWSWVLTDLIIYPLIDGAFAFVCFNLPLLYYSKKQRRGEDYFSR